MNIKDNSYICPFCNKNYYSCTDFFEKHLKLCLKNPSNNYTEEPQNFELNKYYLPNQKLKFKCSKCGKERISFFKSLNKELICRHCRSSMGFNKIKNQINWKERNFKREQTQIKKYGSIEEATKQRLEKSKYTCIERYGVENIFQSKIVQNKLHKKLRDKGGCGSANPYTKQKVLSTWKRRDPMFKKHSFLLRKNWKNKTKKEISQRSKKFKKTCIDRYGVSSPSQLKNTQQSRRSRYLYDNLNFDSKPELAFYIYCKDQGLDIKRCSKAFKYNFEGKIYFYFPDFEIDEKYYEIKGDHFLTEEGKWQNPFNSSLNNLYEAKHQCSIKNNVIILYEYQKYIDYVNQKYGRNYLKDFKKKN